MIQQKNKEENNRIEDNFKLKTEKNYNIKE